MRLPELSPAARDESEVADSFVQQVILLRADC